MGKLTGPEVEVIEMIDGKRPPEWGAWVAACLEYMRGAGYITDYVGAKPTVTARGRAALKETVG